MFDGFHSETPDDLMPAYSGLQKIETTVFEEPKRFSSFLRSAAGGRLESLDGVRRPARGSIVLQVFRNLDPQLRCGS
jgi:hypothetical protein